MTVSLVGEIIVNLLRYMAKHKEDLKNLTQSALADILLRVMHEFLLIKVKESRDKQENTASKFYNSSTFADHE